MDISSAAQRTVTDAWHLPFNGVPTSAPATTPPGDPVPNKLAHILPSTREIELETLLRQRDAQNEQLTVEIATLRRCLAKQPQQSTSEPVTLPHPLLSLLLPYLADPLTGDLSTSNSNSVIIALKQRTELLQEENDELYELLKRGETGRLKEEVHGLRRALRKMEAALKESHGIIQTLSLELDKCYETISRSSDAYQSSGPPQPFPETSGKTRTHPNHAASNAPSATKPIPTGPRAQKRRRLSSHQSLSPQQPLRPLPSTHGNPPSPRRTHTTLPSNPRQSGSTSRMEQDEDPRGRTTPDREWQRDRGRDRDGGRDIPGHHPLSRRSKERDRERERERERDRDRDREWERDRERGGRRGRDRRTSRGSTSTNGVGTRGLAERMGL